MKTQPTNRYMPMCTLLAGDLPIVKLDESVVVIRLPPCADPLALDPG